MLRYFIQVFKYSIYAICLYRVESLVIRFLGFWASCLHIDIVHFSVSYSYIYLVNLNVDTQLKTLRFFFFFLNIKGTVFYCDYFLKDAVWEIFPDFVTTDGLC